MKSELELSVADRECLAGRHGEVLRFAMEMLGPVGEASGRLGRPQRRW